LDYIAIKVKPLPENRMLANHRSRTLAFEHGELLPEGEDLEGAITPGLKERAERGKAGEERIDEHEAILFNMA
jgi:hypothetical protein